MKGRHDTGVKQPLSRLISQNGPSDVAEVCHYVEQEFFLRNKTKFFVLLFRFHVPPKPFLMNLINSFTDVFDIERSITPEHFVSVIFSNFEQLLKSEVSWKDAAEV